jgi:hypothetical protein
MTIDLNIPAATSLTITPQPKKPFEYTTGKKVAATEAEFLGHDNGFGFSDFLDIINPLQHIPIVSNIYRAITGDEASSGAKVLGGGLFGAALGGVTGLVAAIADEIFQGETGKSSGDTVIALVNGTSQAAGSGTREMAAAGFLPSGSRQIQSEQILAPAAEFPEEPTQIAGLMSGKLAMARYREAQTMAGLQDTVLRAAFANEDKKSGENTNKQSKTELFPYQDWLSALDNPS